MLCLTGNVDTGVATRFRSEHGRERVAVDAIDAGDVTFLSSSGLSLLLLYAETSVAAGRCPVLRSVSRQMERVLQLAGIDALWQQFFVGLFLIIAVLLEQIRNRGRSD